VPISTQITELLTKRTMLKHHSKI
jgi:hypothetical protein